MLTYGGLNSYSNIIWMTIVTMTTVGYGEFVPKTEAGRILGSLCVTWGVLIVSIMVVVLTNTFSMNRSKKLVYN
jgi:voltage-gated potassium channel